jgi:F-type H+-transporting ATPase subunit gamma
MRKAQGRAFAGRSYARAAVSILARVSGSRELAANPLTEVRAVNHALYIVITSDKGLAGALNSAVLRATVADMKTHGLTTANTSIIAVGRKANDFFTARGFNILSYKANTDLIDAAFIDTLVHSAADVFTKKEVDVVKVAYQNFISTFEQRPTLRTIFPLSLTELEEVVGDILPAKGAYAVGTTSSREAQKPQTYTVEPSEQEVLAAILPRLASIFVYHALLESQASEHSARMVSMKSASDKAEELTDTFTLQYNKARQAAITREVSEITGGMEAMQTN